MDENRFFPEIKKNFGFGLMRLPMVGSQVDTDQVSKMVDAFIDNGFNYFDTAHGYIGGLSECAVKTCLSSRYPREKFLLTDKLTESYFEKEEDIVPFFESQLEACGVDYFDFYLMHAQNKTNFEKFKKCNAYETAFKLKEEGKIKHVGLSFHDTADVLRNILTQYPQIEIVQIQFNYLDYDDPSVQSKEVYDVCEEFHKPVIVMEPVKGGSLVNLSPEAQMVLDDLNKSQGTSYSNAGYAIRYAASFPSMCMVLSGMSSFDQMNDNISAMKDFSILNEEEIKAVYTVSDIIKSVKQIPCTSCHYCVLDNHCPKDIKIPELFSCYNAKIKYNDWNQNMYYEQNTTDAGKASDCIKCGMCEKVCPQHLEIRNLLEEVAKTFEG
ncbi:MAG: aldo/keto reductase [Pseudobutyrivibrio sp.]|nr:aldo/keto reductase [Pseudobutyrivibrio sp.]